MKLACKLPLIAIHRRALYLVNGGRLMPGAIRVAREPSDLAYKLPGGCRRNWDCPLRMLARVARVHQRALATLAIC